MRRYPLGPLLAILRDRGLTTNHHRILGVSSAGYRKVEAQGLAEAAADRVAVSLGLHPSEVWPEWTDDGVEAERARRRKAQAEWARRKYRDDPEHRVKKSERNRSYYAESSDAISAATRRYRETHRDEIAAAKREWWAKKKNEQNARRREQYARRRLLQAAEVEFTSYQNPGLTSSSTGFPPGFGGWCPSDPQGDRRRITAVGFDPEMENR